MNEKSLEKSRPISRILSCYC